MTVTIERDEDLKIIALDGELQATNADSIRDEVIALIDKKPMIISMEKCTYVSSAGLRAMLMIAKIAKARKVKVLYAAVALLTALEYVWQFVKVVGLQQRIRRIYVLIMVVNVIACVICEKNFALGIISLVIGMIADEISAPSKEYEGTKNFFSADISKIFFDKTVNRNSVT